MKINALSHSISLEDTKLIITPLHEHVIAKMLIYVRAPIIYLFLNSPSSYPKNTSHMQLICSLMLLNLLNQPF